jgi:tight adherence protein B
VGRALDAADVGLPPVQAVPIGLASWGAGTVAGALLGGLGGAAAGALVGIGGPALALWLRSGRRDERVTRRLPGVLESMAADVRAGSALADALRRAGAEPTSSTALDSDLARCRHELDHGAEPNEVMTAWAARRPLPGVRLAAAAVALGGETGGARAQVLDAVASTLRERAALAREVSAHSAQARASAAVIIAAPVVFAALGLMSSPGVAAFLFHTRAGFACLVSGLLLDGLGAAWIGRLARPPG